MRYDEIEIATSTPNASRNSLNMAKHRSILASEWETARSAQPSFHTETYPAIHIASVLCVPAPTSDPGVCAILVVAGNLSMSFC